MGLTSHLSDAYDSFSSSCVSFSLLLSPMKMTPTNQTMKISGSGFTSSSCVSLCFELSIDRVS